MGILAKKVFREIRRNKGRSISIVAILMVSTGLYAGLLLAYEGAIDTFDGMEDDSSMHSVRYSLNDYVNIENLSLSGIEHIENWDARISTITAMRVEEYAKETYTTPLFGVPQDRIPLVDNYASFEGGTYFTGKDQIITITQFVKGQKMEIGQKLFLETPLGKKELILVGEVTSPEYIYNVNPISGLPDMAGLAASWIPIQTLRDTFGLPNNTVNEVLVRFDKGISDDVRDQLVATIKQRIKDIAPQTSLTLAGDELERNMRDADIGALDEFARVFGVIILVLALFVMYDNMSKLIASQRNIIGTMRALGGHKKTVVSHYTWLSLILGIIGVLLGIPFGKLIADEMVIGYAGVLGIPTPVSEWHINAFIESISINFGMAFLIAFLSSLGAAKIQPREAMASAFVTIVYRAKPILERITSKIPGLNSPSMTIPFRGLFRQRRKTLLTIFTYGISMILLITSLGFMDSFALAIDTQYGDIQKEDFQVHFVSPINPTEVKQITDTMQGINKVEFFSTTNTEMKAAKTDLNKTVAVNGLPDDITLRGFNIVEGDKSGLIISTLLADDFDIKVGDDIILFNQTMEIKGITSEMIGDSVFVKLSAFQEIMHQENNVTSMFVKANDNTNLDNLKNDLLDSDLPILIVIASEEIKEGINAMIQGLFAMIAVFMIIGFGTILLFSFNTIVLDAMSREMEFINLRTLGAGRGKIFKIIATQAVIVSILGSLIAIPLSYWATDYANTSMVEGLMDLVTYIKPESYFSGIVVAIIASSVGVYSAYKRMMNINLADAMRTRVAN